MRTILGLMLAVMMQPVLAQKTTIGLLTFEASSFEDHSEAELLTEKVKEIFFESKRFRPIDRTRYAEVNKFKEEEIQKNIGYINGYVAEQGVKDGARSIIGGKLTSLSYATTKNGSIKCDLSFSITINDIETGEMLATKTFDPGIISTGLSGSTRTQALNNAVRSFTKKVENFIINNVPFYALIQQIEPVKKSAEILIVAGENEGVSKGDRFGIYEVTEIDTQKGVKIRKRLISKFPIKIVEGDFSTAIVGKGSDVLLKKYNDENVTLVCQSMPKGGLSF
ncbi:MAG: hypothetical protein AAF039_00795 [Bacteroidota bacterium]